MGILLGKASRRWFWTLAGVGFVLVVLLGRCALAECLSSPAEVRAAHSVTAWSTWNYIDGRKCWHVGHNRYPRAAEQSRPPRRSPSGLPGRTVGSIPATGAIPLPRFFADQVPRGDRYKPTEEGRRLAGVMETTVDRVHRRLLEVGFDERFRAAYEK